MSRGLDGAETWGGNVGAGAGELPDRGIADVKAPRRRHVCSQRTSRWLEWREQRGKQRGEVRDVGVGAGE